MGTYARFTGLVKLNVFFCYSRLEIREIFFMRDIGADLL